MRQIQSKFGEDSFIKLISFAGIWLYSKLYQGALAIIFKLYAQLSLV